jgi:hypothetical protein
MEIVLSLVLIVSLICIVFYIYSFSSTTNALSTEMKRLIRARENWVCECGSREYEIEIWHTYLPTYNYKCSSCKESSEGKLL